MKRDNIMGSILTFGETMAAFSPETTGPLRYVSKYDLRSAGAESNVAVGLAKLGVSSVWMSRLGNDELGRFIINNIRAEGVDCSKVVIDPDHRTGLMVKQLSRGETQVFYYRDGSAASCLAEGDITEELFSGVTIVHMTGITPVLSASCRKAVNKAYKLARSLGIRISFDPNIRRKLWKGTDYTEYIRSLALDSDILMMGEDECEALFGTSVPEKAFETVFDKSRVKYCAIKCGERGAFVSDGKERFVIDPYPCDPVDPVGAGDGFDAGFLSGIISGKSVYESGRIGAICGALATETNGDIEGYPDKETLEKILNNDKTVFR